MAGNSGKGERLMAKALPAAQDFVALLEERAPRPLSIDEMVRLLGLEHYNRKQVRTALEAEVATQRLRRIGKTRYQWRAAEPRRPALPQDSAPPRGRRGKSAKRPLVRIEGR